MSGIPNTYDNTSTLLHASTPTPSTCHLATWSVQTDGPGPNFESHVATTSSSLRGEPRALAICFLIYDDYQHGSERSPN